MAQARQQSPHQIDITSEVSLRPVPYLSILAVIVPAAFLVAGSVDPALFSGLERDPQALAHGQWWRLYSPLLVDSDGWPQWLAVSLGFICVGIPVEHHWERWRWLLLLFAGATAGEILGYLWQPDGGGSSIALCGLIGGLAIHQLWPGQSAFFLANLFAACLVIALVGLDLGSIWLLIGMIVVFALLFRFFLTRRPSQFVWFVSTICLLGALVLLVLRDIHGGALLAGMLVGALLTLPRLTRVTYQHNK